MKTETPQETLLISDRQAPAYIGISKSLWQELKKSQPQIIKPSFISSKGWQFFSKKDIAAALIANKIALAQ